jgi:hypothetical protein
LFKTNSKGMNMGRFLEPEDVERFMELASKPYRPTEIVKLKEEIEGEIRAAELNASVTGRIDYDRVQKIVNMKLRLDVLYTDWAEGRIS